MVDEWVQRDPIVVDRESSVILDGMHRFAALANLGIRYAVCLEQDYIADDEVRVFRWLRYLRKPKESSIGRMRAALGLSRSTSAQEALAAVNSGQRPIALIGGREGFTSHGAEDRDSYEMVRSFDRVALGEGEEVEIVEEAVGLDLVQAGGMVLVIPPIKKRDVLRAGETHRPFPHKTTLHVLPLRILGINFALSELERRELAQASLSRLISAPRFRVVEPPANYEGRGYGERVAVLER